MAQFSLGEPVTSVAVAGDLLFIALLTGSVRVVDLVVSGQLLVTAGVYCVGPVFQRFIFMCEP